MKGNYTAGGSDSLRCLEEHHPQMKGNYTHQPVLDGLQREEHHPQMKGNYTPDPARIFGQPEEHHPQMKGNYTALLVEPVRPAEEHHPQMKGNYTSRPASSPARREEHHPQMKGNYTVSARTSVGAPEEHHPQMKGNYTRGRRGGCPRVEEHHPQMKGNYTERSRSRCRRRGRTPSPNGGSCAGLADDESIFGEDRHPPPPLSDPAREKRWRRPSRRGGSGNAPPTRFANASAGFFSRTGARAPPGFPRSADSGRPDAAARAFRAAHRPLTFGNGFFGKNSVAKFASPLARTTTAPGMASAEPSANGDCADGSARRPAHHGRSPETPGKCARPPAGTFSAPRAPGAPAERPERATDTGAPTAPGEEPPYARAAEILPRTSAAAAAISAGGASAFSPNSARTARQSGSIASVSPAAAIVCSTHRA